MSICATLSGWFCCKCNFEPNEEDSGEWTQADRDRYKNAVKIYGRKEEFAAAFLKQKELFTKTKEDLDSLRKIGAIDAKDWTQEQLNFIRRINGVRSPNDPIGRVRTAPIATAPQAAASEPASSASAERLSPEQLVPLVQECRDGVMKASSVTGQGWGAIDSAWEGNPTHRKNVIQRIYQVLLGKGLSPSQARQVFMAFPEDSLKQQVITALRSIE